MSSSSSYHHDVSTPITTKDRKKMSSTSPSSPSYSPKGVMDIMSFVDVDGGGECVGGGNVVDGHPHLKTPTFVVEEDEEEEKEEPSSRTTVLDVDTTTTTTSVVVGVEEVDESLKTPMVSRPYVSHCTIRPSDEILSPILRTVLMQGHAGDYRLVNRAFKDMFDDVFVKQLNFTAQGSANSLLYIREKNTMGGGGSGSSSSSRRGRIAVISCQEEETSSFQDWIVITPDTATSTELLLMLRTHGMVAHKNV